MLLHVCLGICSLSMKDGDPCFAAATRYVLAPVQIPVSRVSFAIHVANTNDANTCGGCLTLHENPISVCMYKCVCVYDGRPLSRAIHGDLSSLHGGADMWGVCGETRRHGLVLMYTMNASPGVLVQTTMATREAKQQRGRHSSFAFCYFRRSHRRRNS